MRGLLIFAVVFLAVSVAGAAPGVLTGPIVSPVNGNVYYSLTSSNWLDAEAKAVEMGGHLATIRNAEEDSWICGEFGGVDTGLVGLWIGLTDAAEEGNFVWISGEPVTYTNWGAGQPDNASNEDYGQYWTAIASSWPACTWNDNSLSINGPRNVGGLVEIISMNPPTSLEIVGPSEVGENSEIQYRAILHYENGGMTDISESVSWSVEPGGYAEVDYTGLLRTPDVMTSLILMLTVVYDAGDVILDTTHEVRVMPRCPAGYALRFDGENDYASAGVLPPLSINDDFTWSFWVRLYEPLTSWDVILGNRMNELVTPAQNEFIKFTPSRFECYSNGGWNISYSLPVGTWVHLAAVKDGNRITCYRDAVAVGHMTVNKDIPSLPLRFGGDPYYYKNEYTPCELDEVSIWNRAVGVDELELQTQRSLRGDEPGLLAYWKFNEGAGQTVYDLTGYGHDAFLGADDQLVDEQDPCWVESDLLVDFCTPVAVDIKPGSCPNPLNLASRGVLPLAILGSPEMNVMDIDVASVSLGGVSPIGSSYEDVAGPSSDSNACACTCRGPDGHIDLNLKFRTEEIAAGLFVEQQQLVKKQILTLSLTGTFVNGSGMVGTDCIVLVGNVPKWLSAMNSDINKDSSVDLLDLAELSRYWMESWKP